MGIENLNEKESLTLNKQSGTLIFFSGKI